MLAYGAGAVGQWHADCGKVGRRLGKATTHRQRPSEAWARQGDIARTTARRGHWRMA